MGTWWLFNGWRLSVITGESWRDFGGVLLIFAWSAISLWLALFLEFSLGDPDYYLLGADGCTSALVCREQFRLLAALFEVCVRCNPLLRR